MKLPIRTIEVENGKYAIVDAADVVIMGDVARDVAAPFVVAANNFKAALGHVRNLVASAANETAKSDAEGFIEYIGSYA